MRDAFAARLFDLARNDRRVMLLSADLGFGVLNRYRAELPDQFLNVGVAEQNLIGIAAGLALEGRKVFVYSIANFPTLRCLEQVRNDVAYHDLDVTIVSVGSGFSYGSLGMSHHGIEDLAIMRSLPRMRVFAPSDEFECEEVINILAASKSPAYLRIERTSEVRLGNEDESFVVGVPRLIRTGKDVVVLASGCVASEALIAAKSLAEVGIDPWIFSVHTLKPFSLGSAREAIRSAGAVLTVEEHVVEGGLGGLVAEEILEDGLPVRRFHRVGIRDGYSHNVGTQAYLRKAYGLDSASISHAIRKLLS